MMSQDKRLDALAKKLCLALAGGKCRVCGYPADDQHHLIRSRAKQVRWEGDNLFAVCRRCHTHIHSNCGHNDELRLLGVSAEEYEALRKESLRLSVGADRVDLDEVERELKTRIKEGK